MCRPRGCACVSVGTRACVSLQSGTLPMTLVITIAKIDCRKCREPHLTLRAAVPGPGDYTWPGQLVYDLT